MIRLKALSRGPPARVTRLCSASPTTCTLLSACMEFSGYHCVHVPCFLLSWGYNYLRGLGFWVEGKGSRSRVKDLRFRGRVKGQGFRVEG